MVVSLSVPFAFKASYWSQAAVGGSAFSELNLERMRKLMPQSEDDPDEAGTPGDWVRTVERMANRQIFEPIEESEQ